MFIETVELNPEICDVSYDTEICRVTTEKEQFNLIKNDNNKTVTLNLQNIAIIQVNSDFKIKITSGYNIKYVQTTRNCIESSNSVCIVVETQDWKYHVEITQEISEFIRNRFKFFIFDNDTNDWMWIATVVTILSEQK